MKPIKMPEVKITKKHIVTASRISSLIVIFALYIFAEFLRANITGGVITSWSYWSVTLINMVLIISTMITVRAIRKDKRLDESADITETMQQIRIGFNRIVKNGLSSELDEYLKKLNRKNKYDTFSKSIQNRLIKIGDKPKKEEERKHLNELLKKTEDEVADMPFKYKPITISKLFSAIDGRIINDNEYDLDTYEGRDVARMVGLQAFFIVLFSAFTGTIVVELVLGGWAVIYSVLLKLFSLLMAINTSMGIADDFVDHNIRTSVQRRYKYLAGFINSDEKIKSLLTQKENTAQTE